MPSNHILSQVIEPIYFSCKALPLAIITDRLATTSTYARCQPHREIDQASSSPPHFSHPKSAISQQSGPSIHVPPIAPASSDAASESQFWVSGTSTNGKTPSHQAHIHNHRHQHQHQDVIVLHSTRVRPTRQSHTRPGP